MNPGALVIVAALAFAAGWEGNGWRLGEQHAEERRKTAELAALDIGRAEDARAVLQSKLDAADRRYTREVAQHAEALNILRRDVESDRVRLRVRATCPPVANLPASAVGGSVDTGAGAELDAAARPDYFALRAGIERQRAQLSACQTVIRTFILQEGAP